jgi:uncharacterized protein (TIGR03435 family)
MNWYDIEAKVEGSPTDDELRLMFQRPLEDRFKLRVHRETREMAVYDLVAAKGGAKLTPAVEDSKLAIEGKLLPAGTHALLMGRDGGHLMGKGAAMAQLVDTLSRGIGGPVTDKTGLQGTYDYDVAYARDDKPGDTGSSLPVAIQNALGLKLERGKGPVEIVVVDHVEKPSQN